MTYRVRPLVTSDAKRLELVQRRLQAPAGDRIADMLRAALDEVLAAEILDQVWARPLALASTPIEDRRNAD